MLFELGAKRFNDIAAEAGIVNKEERKTNLHEEEPRESALEPVQEQSKEASYFEPVLNHDEI